MRQKLSNWVTITESRFSWEQDALTFIQQQFPPYDSYQAWANLEFIALDGSINEIDLLVFSPQGFFVIEIKSRPGKITGDAGTWIWEQERKRLTLDNPLISVNLKAKKLRSLLESQRVCSRKSLPFIEALVFCSAPDIQIALQGTARYRICERQTIMGALTRRDCPGLSPLVRGIYDRPTLKTVSQGLEQAGIRPSQRYRQVSDYRLGELIEEGQGYQDWQATHVSLANVQRRLRQYLVQGGASQTDRRPIEQAAKREFQLLENLAHPGILQCRDYKEQNRANASYPSKTLRR